MGIFQPNVFQNYVFQLWYLLDTERACVHNDERLVTMAAENRTAIVLFEDRVNTAIADRPEAASQPRKRTC